MPGPVKPVIPDRPGTVVHALKLVQALLVGYAVFLALFLKWLHPRPAPMALCILCGLALGLAYSFLHHANKARKERLAALVRPSLFLPPIRPRQVAPCPHVPSATSWPNRRPQLQLVGWQICRARKRGRRHHEQHPSGHICLLLKDWHTSGGHQERDMQTRCMLAGHTFSHLRQSK